MKNSILTTIILIFGFSTLTAEAEDMSHCSSFIAKDADLSDYVQLTPDGAINRDYLQKAVTSNPKASYTLGADSGKGKSVDVIRFPSGTANKAIQIQRKGGQLDQILITRVAPIADMQPTTFHNVTQTYIFSHTKNKCFPKLGLETNAIVNQTPGLSSNLNLEGSSQLFDSELCQRLSNFFSKNPTALQCEQTYEDQTTKLLENYKRSWRAQSTNLMGPGHFELNFSENPYLSYPTISSMPSEASKRTEPKSKSRLSLAIALFADCQKDPRLKSTLGDTTLFEKSAPPSSKTQEGTK